MAGEALVRLRTTPPPLRHTDTLIIGGGQAGLATAYEIGRRGGEALVLEAHATLGDNWRARWAGLRLFTPNRYNSLPGLRFPGAPYDLPDRLAVADYLGAYATTHGLAVELGARVTRVVTDTEGGFLTETADGRHFTSRRVVIAAGAYRTPRLPSFAERLPPALPALHSSALSDPDAWLPEAGRRVLVVGAGASGGQLAVALSRKHHVTLAGRDPGALPRRLLGRDVYDFLYGLGLMGLRVDGVLGRRLAGRTDAGEIAVGPSVAQLAEAYGLTRVGRIDDYVEGGFRTVDGEVIHADAVVFATGYRNRYDFLQVAGALDAEGRPLHRAGVSPVAGLYWVGLHLMRRISSSLLGGVGADARDIARLTC